MTFVILSTPCLHSIGFHQDLRIAAASARHFLSGPKMNAFKENNLSKNPMSQPPSLKSTQKIAGAKIQVEKYFQE
jgi:hypothetical protein